VAPALQPQRVAPWLHLPCVGRVVRGGEVHAAGSAATLQQALQPSAGEAGAGTDTTTQAASITSAATAWGQRSTASSAWSKSAASSSSSSCKQQQQQGQHGGSTSSAQLAVASSRVRCATSRAAQAQPVKKMQGSPARR
jgi:hypothetical protein